MNNFQTVAADYAQVAVIESNLLEDYTSRGWRILATFIEAKSEIVSYQEEIYQEGNSYSHTENRKKPTVLKVAKFLVGRNQDAFVEELMAQKDNAERASYEAQSKIYALLEGVRAMQRSFTETELKQKIWGWEQLKDMLNE